MAERLTPGQRLQALPSKDWNEFCDAANLVQRLANLANSPPPASHPGAPTTVVAVFNTSEANIEPGRPVVYSKPYVPTKDGYETPAYENVVMEGGPPEGDEYDPEDSTTKWGIAITALPTNTLGSMATHGLTWAWVDIKSEDDTTCGLLTDPGEYDDPTILVSGQPGAEIVWKEKAGDEYEAVGEQWCVVLLGGGGGSDSLIAKITATIGAREGTTLGSGTVALGHIEEGEWVEEIDAATAYNTSLSPIHVPSEGDIMMSANKIKGEWVLSPLELHQLKGFAADKDQSIGHDAEGDIEFQDDGDCDEEPEE